MADAIHPELAWVARLLPRASLGPRSLRIYRGLTHLVDRKADHSVAVVRVNDAVTVRVHRPAAAPSAGPAPVVLWIHGGGMVLGTAAIDDKICKRFAADLGVTVVAVDYRLAPEHPFPTPLEDCYAALLWLAGQPAVDPSRIAIAGASAGGGLAAGLAIMARERGAVTPVFQLLVYPMIDDRSATRPELDGMNLRMWSRGSNLFGWLSYTGLAPGSADVPYLAAPARCPDLAGLPAAWVGVGSCDLFHDEDVEYARRLTEAGVSCTLSVIPGAFHGFDGVRPRATVSRDFIAAQVEALRAGLGLA